MKEAVLPPLREDLALLPGPLVEGAPTWSIYDPARHRFLRLGWLDFEILSRWRLRTIAEIIESIRGETTLRPGEDDIKRFATFAYGAGLLQAATPLDTQRFVQEQQARRHSFVMWLIHNYLFIRLRLIDPDRLLTTLLPLLRGLYSRSGLVTVGALGLFALFLISRQWETYTHSLAEQTTFEGLLQMGVALSVAKVFHEIGHGLAAKRFGCRVPSMGIAFLVLWPVLWTDTTDAWRLVDRRQRLMIDVAGMATEIAIAALASIAWAVLPDGPMRSVMFVLSSSTWILTLFVNLSPLMRFDGYYILSDLLDFPNLQERGFAYTRWFLRELMFRPRRPPPERLPPAMARAVIAYSVASWTYRFFLFMGIAVLVYHVTFKALGIVLMAIEIWFFLARPIVRELIAWAKLATLRRPNRHSLITLGLFALLLAALVVPWRGRIDAPALLRAERQILLLTSEPGRLAYRLPSGAHVAEGEVIYRLESIELEHDVAAARARLEQVQAQNTAGSFNPDRRRDQQTNLARAAEAAAALAHAEQRSASLEIRAPFAGQLRDVPEGLRLGDYVRRLERLSVLVSEGAVVEAYVAESDLERVRVGAAARFIPVDGPALSLVVAEVAHTSTRALEVAELASTHEGPIPVRRSGSSGPLVPDAAVYRVLLTGAAALPVASSRTVGEVVIDAPARSFVVALYRRAVAVLLREATP
jgi:putative peptide zinc metalloprotease protein